MKILFYNWVDYLDDEKRGGGVSVYQRNLLRELNAKAEYECAFLSSGIAYDLFPRTPRWERVKHGPKEDRNRRFEIVNSGILSPAHHSFGDDKQLDDPATLDTFLDFIRHNGPFDVIHFNNLEGLPASALRVKEHWPETRVIFSLHNYYPLCPQVNLWHQEHENCLDFGGGKKCADCLPHQHDPRTVRLANAVAFTLKKRGIRPGTRLFDRGFSPAMRLAHNAVRLYNLRNKRKTDKTDFSSPPLLKRIEGNHKKYAHRRAKMIELINTHCDKVLCVSNRVGDVAVKFGIAPDLVETSYIGTRHAEKFDQTAPAPTIVQPDGTFTMAYLGYMRLDKGFSFLLNALETLPDTMARRINIVIASRLVNQKTMTRISHLSAKFNSVLFANGYTHEQLDDILSEVNLGVIPVLWEDNLPQVAIEMHARHIPLLTSNLGGAQELGGYSRMVFKAGDTTDFTTKIKDILDGKVSMETYWKQALRPHSMSQHLDDLHHVYDTPARPIERKASQNTVVHFKTRA